ncbi:hypothetical protein ACQCN2_07520 [Brevibacillus ginsengisoli]
MFWPFATSVEELLIYTGRADLFYYADDQHPKQEPSDETSGESAN